MSLKCTLERSLRLFFVAVALCLFVTAPSAPVLAEDGESEQTTSEIQGEANAPADAGEETATDTSNEAATDAEAPASEEAPAASEPAQPAEPATKKAADENAPPVPDDYYAKRAKEVLKSDASTGPKPHPLAAAYPDHYVVVCDGGCPGRKSEAIVSMMPRQQATEETVSSMVPTASGASTLAAADTGPIVCVAGCYNTPKSYLSRAGGSVAGTGGVSWMTSVADSPTDAPAAKLSNNGGSGDWMKRINQEHGKPASASPAPVKDVPANEALQKDTAAKDAAAKDTAVTAKPAPVVVVVPAAPAAEKPSDTAPAEVPAAASVAVDAAKAEPSVGADAAKTVAAPAPADAAPATNSAAPAAAPATAPVSAPADTKAEAPASTETKPAPAAMSEPAAAAAPMMPEMKTAYVAPASQTAAPAAEGPAIATEQPVAEAAPATEKEAPAPFVSPAASAEMMAASKETRVAALASEEPAKTEEKPSVAASDAAKAAIKEQVVTVASDDPAMNAAIKRARETLPAFFAAMDKPGPGEKDFSIKMAISEGNSIEHFWLVDVKREDGKLMGTINNEPETVKSVSMGQRMEIVEARISDWMYKRKSKMVGNETMRPLLKAMSKEEAAPYWAMYEKP